MYPQVTKVGSNRLSVKGNQDGQEYRVVTNMLGARFADDFFWFPVNANPDTYYAILKFPINKTADGDGTEWNQHHMCTVAQPKPRFYYNNADPVDFAKFNLTEEAHKLASLYEVCGIDDDDSSKVDKSPFEKDTDQDSDEDNSADNSNERNTTTNGSINGNSSTPKGGNTPNNASSNATGKKKSSSTINKPNLVSLLCILVFLYNFSI